MDILYLCKLVKYLDDYSFSKLNPELVRNTKTLLRKFVVRAVPLPEVTIDENGFILLDWYDVVSPSNRTFRIRNNEMDVLFYQDGCCTLTFHYPYMYPEELVDIIKRFRSKKY